jgi:uncharacterized protein (TIGR00255 family)
VNNRHLDVRVRCAPELGAHAPLVEQLLRERLERGRVEASLTLERGARFGVHLDRDRARTAFAELSALRDELCPGDPVPLSLLALVPDLFAAEQPIDSETGERAVGDATRAAIRDLDVMRVREGEALGRDLEARLRTSKELSLCIEERAPLLAGLYQKKLVERVERLLEGTLTLDPARVAQEVAILADRSDVSEELTRLSSHLAQLGALLTDEAPAVGRKIDFLLQEVNREVNTIGTKASDASIAHVVVALKAELEKMREQVQNVI